MILKNGGQLYNISRELRLFFSESLKVMIISKKLLENERFLPFSFGDLNSKCLSNQIFEGYVWAISSISHLWKF